MSEEKLRRRNEFHEKKERLKKVREKIRELKRIGKNNEVQKYLDEYKMLQKELFEMDLEQSVQSNKLDLNQKRKEIEQKVVERKKRFDEIKKTSKSNMIDNQDEKEIDIMQNPQPCCNDCIVTDDENGCSVAEGFETIASGFASHAEGEATNAIGIASHAEGSETTASAGASHAEGGQTTASGFYSHAEGNDTLASGTASHAEGWLTEATAFASHAEGNDTLASGSASHAEGWLTEASGFASHAQGSNTIANGAFSHTEGLNTSANSLAGVHVMGKYGAANDLEYSWYLANGLSPDLSGIAAKILQNGIGAADIGWIGGGADYAEMFETVDGKPIDVGYFVTLVGKKIRKANGKDDYILGVTSANPAVLADGGELRWKGKYVTDEWGRIQYHNSQPVLNPKWDPTKEYVSRLNRPEWVAVGMIGKLLVRDDGTCQVDGYCRPNDKGIGTASTKGYRVMKRTGPNQILILFNGNKLI